MRRMGTMRGQEESKLDPDFLDNITMDMRADLMAEENRVVIPPARR